ncbi:R of type II restriction and modification system, partial [Acinetobacter pittii 42F]
FYILHKPFKLIRWFMSHFKFYSALKQNSYRDKLNYLFIATCIKKSLGYKYSWGDSISHKKIQKDKISLPVINQQIDYNFMRNFIGAIQKMIVKDILVYINNLKNDNW